MNSQTSNSSKHYTNNTVEFSSNQPIDSNHLDILIIFLENPTLSGGGNISGYTINAQKTLISVNYEQEISKHRILNKQRLDIHGYILEAAEPMLDEYQDTLNLDKRLLVLKNVAELHDSVVRAYAENLAIVGDESNQIIFACRSHYFKQLFYIRFENEIDIEYCRQRLDRRPTLHGRKIEIQNGYFTNTLFFRIQPFLKTRMSVQSVEAYFMNKKRFEQNPVVSIKQYQSVYLLKFDSETSMSNFLTHIQSPSLKMRFSPFGLVSGISHLFELIYFENLYDITLLAEQLELRETLSDLSKSETIHRGHDSSRTWSPTVSMASVSDNFRVRGLNVNIFRKTQIKFRSLLNRIQL